MALSTVNTNLVPILWGRELWTEILRDLWFRKFIGVGKENIVQIKDELGKKKGESIRFGLRMKLTGGGVTGDNERAGNEEALDIKDDECDIDQLWHGVTLKGRMEEQKAAYNMRSEAKAGLKDWWTELLDEYFIRFLSGDTSLTFANTGTAPDAGHLVFAGGLAKATITTANTFDVECIKRAKQLAKVPAAGTPKVPPLMIGGKPHWIMILHPYQADDLKSDSEWLQSQRNANIRGEKNPIFSGALGVYDGVVLHEHEKCLTFSDYGTGVNLPAARAILCGRQAALFGRQKEVPRWHEETIDRGNKFHIGADMIFGIKKAVFNSKDFSVVACDSYATTM